MSSCDLIRTQADAARRRQADKHKRPCTLFISPLSGTPLQPRDAAEVVRKLATAMQAAHEAKVIHRDLKPANVLLSGEPASG